MAAVLSDTRPNQAPPYLVTKGTGIVRVIDSTIQELLCAKYNVGGAALISCYSGGEMEPSR